MILKLEMQIRVAQFWWVLYLNFFILDELITVFQYYVVYLFQHHLLLVNYLAIFFEKYVGLQFCYFNFDQFCYQQFVWKPITNYRLDQIISLILETETLKCWFNSRIFAQYAVEIMRFQESS
eukprot:TRINITY_DN14630_c0_g2_i8.p2 TRINITY_DN14630_c0_g2~~TRINITY_DN14630_c0_g2_i8.p2  ORF type:complete len:122 (+),score=0.58 TRINITY_DN14630_c0_g2_i8:429-794(+)